MRFDGSASAAIWDRLLRGKALEGLGLQHREGRTDLAGLQLPEPTIRRRFQMAGASIAELEPNSLEVRGVRWDNLDLSRAKLNGLRFHDTEIVGCCFNSCQAKDWRVWGTTFRDCDFKNADFRNSMLAGVENGQQTVYSGVDFSGADLRKTTYKAAGFERCTFQHAKLEKVDFQSSTFADCVFEGELRDVLFYARGHDSEGLPENEMKNVDFSRAKLRYVGFRGLKLDHVMFPDDEDHLVIKDPDTTLDQLTAALRKTEDVTADKLAAFLNIGRKWVVKNQKQKVINKWDLVETVGPGGLKMLLSLLH